MKNPVLVEAGRRGGKIGGHVRAEALSPERRSQIARMAALKRWANKPKEVRMPIWTKTVTASEAIRSGTNSGDMPFIRCTKGEASGIDHRTWFRETLFGNENWRNPPEVPERITAEFDVTINGYSFGPQFLELDHDPERAQNHGAPTMHIHYSPAMKSYLEANDITGETLTISTAGGNALKIE